MTTIIKIENLSKKYVIGHQRQERYSTLRDVMMHKIRGIGERLRHPLSPNREKTTLEEFWALKDINLEIKQGDRVGIIGRNGAGKSTLLKVLSRITEPTTGRIKINGRVASLLEVGTGFHPELTGRENIFLNGAILGMCRVDIKKNFDEIVAFAEVEKFLDTPVKRYSSGMYVRLAFAVAAHLEPEILLVDEVLAVGDAQFQKKCLGKMGEVAEDGRTVLFVSHNMGAISRLCNRALMLNAGEIEKDGLSVDVISSYLQVSSNKDQHFLQQPDNSIPLCLIEAEVFSDENTALDSFPRHKPITVRLQYRINREISSVHVYSNIMTFDGTVVLGTSDADADQSKFASRKPGIYICQYQIPPRILNEGSYTVSISLGVPYQRNFQENNGILTFSVVDIEPIEKVIHRRRAGIIWLDIPWNYQNEGFFL